MACVAAGVSTCLGAMDFAGNISKGPAAPLSQSAAETIASRISCIPTPARAVPQVRYDSPGRYATPPRTRPYPSFEEHRASAADQEVPKAALADLVLRNVLEDADTLFDQAVNRAWDEGAAMVEQMEREQQEAREKLEKELAMCREAQQRMKADTENLSQLLNCLVKRVCAIDAPSIAAAGGGWHGPGPQKPAAPALEPAVSPPIAATVPKPAPPPGLPVCRAKAATFPPAPHQVHPNIAMTTAHAPQLEAAMSPVSDARETIVSTALRVPEYLPAVPDAYCAVPMNLVPVMIPVQLSLVELLHPVLAPSHPPMPTCLRL